jgi:ABC-type nitrate/sulfonate/bicarbonate transport system substrate-binding protein
MTGKIRVGHSSHGAGNVPMALGVGEGYFRDAGLDVEMIEMPRTGDAIKKLIAGEIEFAVAGAVPIINAARAGHEPIIVMSIEAENVFAIMGSKAIKKPDDLRGTRVAISGIREQDEMMIRRALREWGIDPDKDVTLEVRGSRGKCWDAIVSGECSAMAATIPQPIHAKAIGLPVLKDYAEDHEPYQAGAVTTTRRYANANPDAVQKFVGAQLRAIRAFQKDFYLSLPYLIQRSKIEDIDVLRETNHLFGHAAEDYVPNPAALGNVLKNLVDVFGEKIDIDVDKILEPSFATRLEGRKPYPAFKG